MKAIIEKLQKYDLIKAAADFKPLGPISNIEIQPVKEYEDYCEPCEAGTADFWSVYVRYNPSKNDIQFGGVDCIVDCSDFDGASSIAKLLGSLLNVEVVGL